MDFKTYYENKKSENRRAMMLFFQSAMNLPKEMLIESNWHTDKIDEIGNIAKDILGSLNVEICDPFYNELGVPCYELNDKCNIETCPFKNNNSM